MVKYQCPICQGNCYSVILEQDQTHDSLTVCPECTKVHFRVSKDDTVMVRLPDWPILEFVETEIIDKDSFRCY